MYSRQTGVDSAALVHTPVAAAMTLFLESQIDYLAGECIESQTAAGQSSGKEALVSRQTSGRTSKTILQSVWYCKSLRMSKKLHKASTEKNAHHLPDYSYPPASSISKQRISCNPAGLDSGNANHVESTLPQTTDLLCKERQISQFRTCLFHGFF